MLPRILFLNYHRLVDPDELTFIFGEYIQDGKTSQRVVERLKTGQRLLTFDGF